jgi:hypothetical protein
MHYNEKQYKRALVNYKENKNDEVYLDGFNYEGDDPDTEFHKKYTWTTQVACPVWGKFYSGYCNKQTILAREKFQELNLDEFRLELQELLDNYNVSISFGCGCCGAGMDCDGLEFSLERNNNV